MLEPAPQLHRVPPPKGSAYIAAIRVVGVGGAGINAIQRMMDAGVAQVDFVAVNTDRQALEISDAPTKISIGKGLTQGLGSGADPAVGRAAAEEAIDQLRAALLGSDMVFVTAGEGGGTGTGAAPVVARIARELGALTVGIVTTPFRFEGTRRRAAADSGVEELRAAWTRSSSSPTTACSRCSTARRRWSTHSRSPTTSSARACRASAT